MRWTEGTAPWLSLRTAVRKGARLSLLGLVGQIARWTPRFWWERASAYFAYTPPFLGPGDFQGSYTPALRKVTDGLQSTYSGTVAITSVNRAVVQQMLPPGLTLAQPQPGTWGAASHPVLHMIGEQRAPSTLVASAVWPVVWPVVGAPGYDEMILVVPFVLRANGTLWHNYVVRMYLNHIIPVFGGNELYGYAKELARLDHAQNGGAVQHTVTSEDMLTTWFRDAIDVTAQPTTASAAANLPRWNDVQKILEMPFLGIRSTDNAFVCSYWELDYSSATIEATVSRHQVVTKFRPGMEPWETMGTVRSAPDGAFTMSQVRWRLAWPWLVQGC
jgi:hypothetical protein